MIEAYRIFFPIGFAFGIYGVLLWIFFWLGWLSFFPALIHAQIMVSGFMLFFVLGFLGTAVPRLTQTKGMALWEFTVGVLLATGLVVATGLRHESCFYLMTLGTILFLMTFMVRRMLTAPRQPPAAFVIALSGLLSGLVGALLLLLQSLGHPSASLAAFGRQLFFHGMMLGLVLGVGTFLVPVLMKSASNEAPNPAALVKQGPKSRAPFFFVASLIPLSFALDIWVTPQGGMTLRALIGLWMGLFVWKLYKKPSRSVLAWSVWSAAWSLVIGLILQVIWPQYFVHIVHVQLIGGYCVLIFAVATQVCVSHGGYSIQLTKTSKALALTTVFLIGAWATRIFAPMISRLYVSHLGYAAATWIAALLLWGWIFIPKIVRVNGQPSDVR